MIIKEACKHPNSQLQSHYAVPKRKAFHGDRVLFFRCVLCGAYLDSNKHVLKEK